MIFVTVGSQLPFDRMIASIDKLAHLFGDKEVVAQVFGMSYQPNNIKTLDYVSPLVYRNYIETAELVISHAGTGTILSVSQMQKPLIVIPRLGKLRETRNDHQVATCKMLEQTCGLQVAYDEDQLREKIMAFMNGTLPIMDIVPPYASDALLGSISAFIDGKKTARPVVVPSGKAAI